MSRIKKVSCRYTPIPATRAIFHDHLIKTPLRFLFQPYWWCRPFSQKMLHYFPATAGVWLESETCKSRIEPMKIKPNKDSAGVLVELGPQDSQIPADPPVESKPVFRLKTILVPIDFSSCSKKALQYAIYFAKQHQATLTLLYVAQVLYPVPEVGAVDVSLMETRMRENGEQELAELIKKEIA